MRRVERSRARGGWTRRLDDVVTFYALWWPHANVLKVGICWNNDRFRDLVLWNSVVTPVVVWYERHVPLWWEKAALWALSDWGYPPGFPNAATAELLLPKGRGWTECFSVPEEDVVRARDLIEEGIEAYGKLMADRAARLAVHRPSSGDAAAAGQVDRGRAAAPRGLERPSPAPRGDAAGRDLAARRDGDRGRPRHAPPAPRGRGILLDRDGQPRRPRLSPPRAASSRPRDRSAPGRDIGRPRCDTLGPDRDTTKHSRNTQRGGGGGGRRGAAPPAPPAPGGVPRGARTGALVSRSPRELHSGVRTVWGTARARTPVEGRARPRAPLREGEPRWLR